MAGAAELVGRDRLLGLDRRQMWAGFAALWASACSRVSAVGPATIDIPMSFGEIAATGDLRHVILMNWAGDFGAFGVCDLEAGKTTVLSTSREWALRSPAISPKGDALAFTATAFGDRAANLFVAAFDGAAPRRVGLRLTYEGPSFSADGRKLLVFAGDQAFGPRQLVEIDLRSGEERRVWSGVFLGGSRTAYDPLRRGYFVAGRNPAPPGPADPWKTFEYDTQNGFPYNFLVPEGSGPALPIASPQSVGRAATFRGVTSGGEVLLDSFRTGEEYRAFLVAPNGRIRTVWRTDVDGIPDGALISSDGARILTARWLVNDLGEPLNRYEIVVGTAGGEVVSTWSSADLQASYAELKLSPRLSPRAELKLRS